MDKVRRCGKNTDMDSEELRAAINLLMAEMETEPDDLHEVHLRLLELLDQLRATGADLPEDLVELERRLGEDEMGAPIEEDTEPGAPA